MKAVNTTFLKAAVVGSIYGALGLMLSLTVSFFLWQRYDGSVDGWRVFVGCDKFLLQIITALVAYLAARSYHPSVYAGIFAASCAALVFRIAELSLYAAKSSRWYSYRDGVIITVVVAAIIGVALGLAISWSSFGDDVEHRS